MAITHLATAALGLLFLGLLGVLTGCTTPRRRIAAAAGSVMVLSAGILALSSLDAQRRAGQTVPPNDGLFNSGARAEAGTVLAAIAERYGGLPRDTVILERQRGSYSLPEGTRVMPTGSYRVTSVRLFDDAPLIEALLDDDPTYGIEARVLVTSNEGGDQWFRLSTWRFGLYLGFLTLPPAGDGPGWRWHPLED